MVQTDAAAVQSPSVSPSAGDIGSPQASRLRRARWLDPRLITGILLVLGSVVVGTRVIAAADQTLPVLVAATDLAPGQALSVELVETRNVMLDGNLDRYVSGPIGDGYVVVRAVGEGELLPRSSVAPATGDGELRYVTIPLPAAEVPVSMNPRSSRRYLADPTGGRCRPDCRAPAHRCRGHRLRLGGGRTGDGRRTGAGDPCRRGRRCRSIPGRAERGHRRSGHGCP